MKAVREMLDNIQHIFKLRQLFRSVILKIVLDPVFNMKYLAVVHHVLELISI